MSEEAGACSSMDLFFKGSIPEAIGTAQRSSKLFLVYIANDSEESLQLENTTWSSSQVVGIIREKVVALRLVHGSVDVVNFSTLYPVSRVPSITVIGFEGSKLWQHDGYITPEVLSEKLQQAVAVYHLQLQQAAARTMAAILGMAQPTVSETSALTQPGSGPAQTASSNRIASTSTEHAEPRPSNEAIQVEAAETSTRVEKKQDEPIASTRVEEKQDEPVASTRVEEKQDEPITSTRIEEKQDEPITSIRVEEKQDEPMTQVESQDMEVPQGAEISRNNMEEGGQSEEDKGISATTNKIVELETAVTTTDATEESKESHEEPSDSSTGQKAEVQMSSPPENPEVKPLKVPDKIQLQIKLTDGSVIRGEFEKSEDLWAVKAYVDANRTDGQSYYKFAVPFPRKVFDVEDYDKALIELNIGYRAVLILVASNEAVQKKCASPGGRWLSYLNPLSYVRGYAGAAPQNQPKSPTSPTGPSGSSPGSPSRTAASRRTSTSSWGANVHTLKHDEDDIFKKGNSYWNGNNTQFGANDDEK